VGHSALRNTRVLPRMMDRSRREGRTGTSEERGGTGVGVARLGSLVTSTDPTGRTGH